MGSLKERKIIATLVAYAGSGVVIIEVAHHILVNHYHFPHQTVDICIVTLAGALLGTLIWRWFRGAEKRPGNVKVEVLVVPLIILLTLAIDLRFIFEMTGISINMLLIGIVALCLGISWIVFKSLQWAASAPELEKEVEVLKPVEEKPIRFPEWKKSIVVLPFDNISPEEAQDYFCDGMTEEIITDLSSIHELRVISRSSAMMLKGSKKEVRDIAKELNVQYVLEGSVRKVGNDLRITAQLIDGLSDSHLWAEKYSGTLEDVFDIQEKVSRSIVDALKLKLGPKEEQKISERSIDNVAAYECYLKANAEIFKFTEDAINLAIRYLQHALDIIGDNALIYSGMALAYWNLVNIGVKQEEYLAKAEECVKKALAMDPEFPKAHAVLGWINHLGNPQKSVYHLKRALAVSPDDPFVLLGLVAPYGYVGKISEAVPLCEKVIKIDPFDFITNVGPGWLCFYDGQYERAFQEWRRLYEMYPKNPYSQFWYSLILAYNKEIDKALSIIDQNAKANPDNVIANLGLILKYGILKDKDRAFQEMTPDFRKTCQRDPTFSHHLAGIFALLETKEEALDWLESAVNSGFINYPLLAEKDPWLENIRGEERFKKLMERVKYAWENFEV